MRQVQREVALLLWQQPAAEPALASDVAHEGFQPVDPVVVARDREALRPLVAAQRPAAPAALGLGVLHLRGRHLLIRGTSGRVAVAHVKGGVTRRQVGLVHHHAPRVVVSRRRQRVLKRLEQPPLVAVVAGVGVGQVAADQHKVPARQLHAAGGSLGPAAAAALHRLHALGPVDLQVRRRHGPGNRVRGVAAVARVGAKVKPQLGALRKLLVREAVAVASVRPGAVDVRSAGRHLHLPHVEAAEEYLEGDDEVKKGLEQVGAGAAEPCHHRQKVRRGFAGLTGAGGGGGGAATAPPRTAAPAQRRRHHGAILVDHAHRGLEVAAQALRHRLCGE
mmetsp:Transcript_20207/g.50848  ORF Transcript_20207/g.50848 Transcript_20207/m.50848 type:complete len:334 (-) Transcript_20207:1550-2551(-)